MTGYAVYYGDPDGSVTNRYDAGDALCVNLNGLTACSSYFFYVVAYDAYGDESAPSNVLVYSPAAISLLQISQSSGVMNLQFQVAPATSCHVEYTPTLNPPVWTVLTGAVADSNGLVVINDPQATNACRFYRATIP